MAQHNYLIHTWTSEWPENKKMNKELLITKVKAELELIKATPVLFMSGVVVLAILFELLIFLLAPSRVDMMNEQLMAKNALIIERDERINQLQDEVIKLQNCISDGNSAGCR